MRTTAAPATPSAPFLICAPAIRNRRNSVQTKTGMPSNLGFSCNISIQTPLAAFKIDRTHLRQPRNSNRHFAQLENTSKSMKTNARRDF
jgi:hypothetical protein